MSGLGSRVKARRLELGWTQEELAQKITRAGSKIGQSGINMLEHRSNGRPGCISELATVLGVSVDWLRTGGNRFPVPYQQATAEDLLAALKQAAHDFADISFSAPAPFADMALKGEQAVRAAIAKARKAT